MNWSVIAILVTVGIAQAGLVVALVDRLFRAEIKTLTTLIEGLKEKLATREVSDCERDREVRDLQVRVQSIEDRLRDCLQGGCSKH